MVYVAHSFFLWVPTLSQVDILSVLFVAISITCISPIEMIRTKMQAMKGFSYKGTK